MKYFNFKPIQATLIIALYISVIACGGSSSSNKFTISTTTGSNGSISPESATIKEGTTADFTLTPDTGFWIDSVTGCGGMLNGTTYSTAAASADCTISASFTTTPKVIGTVPVDGATGVERDSVVSALFSEDMFALTVDDASFTLADGGNVTATVSFNALTNEATLTPDDSLSMITTYTATLTTAITDLGGNPLASDEAWSFTTADGAWGTPGLIENINNGDAQYPQIAINDSGDAMAVWQQSDGTRDNIWASRYTAGIGWGATIKIENDDEGDARYPQVAVDDAGNAVAVWQQSDGTLTNIMYNRYVVGSGWSLIGQPVDNDDTGSTADPQVAVDSSGNAIAVWRQRGIAYRDIFASRYAVGTGWSTPELVDIQDEGYAEDPQVAMNGAGNAVAVWHQKEDNNTEASANIWASYYTVGPGWSTAELIETTTGQANYPKVAIDNAGNALAVWQQSDGANRHIWANRYAAGTGWAVAELIETEPDEDAIAPQIAMNGAGDALVVWEQNSSSPYWDAWANHYTVGAGWGTAELIESNNSVLGTSEIAIDGAGNGLAVWTQLAGGGGNIWANRYTTSMGWGTAETIASDGGSHPEIAIDGKGNALAVWFQSDGTRDNIWANRFE